MSPYRILVALGLVVACCRPLAGQFSEERELETAASSAKPPSRSAKDLESVAKVIVSQTNEFRKSQELSPVSINANLTVAAQYFADYMARTDRYAHTADGKLPADRAQKHGYEYCIVSENIAYQYSSVGFQNEELASKLVEGWKNSPGHRKNMLEPFVLETGVAVAKSANTDHYYAVQMFGRPKSKAIEFSIKNSSEQTVQYTIAEHTFTLSPLTTRTHSRCRPPVVHVTLGESSATTQTLKPESGDGYEVAVQDGELRVHKQ